MKNKEQYKQTKFKVKGDKITPSNESKYLFGGSWLNTKYIADMYQIYVPLYVRGQLLDLGCGFAPLYDLYKNYIDEVVCADWENTFHKNELLDVVCDLNEKLQFDNDTFDTIILSDVIEHIKNPYDLMQECKRILKQNGYLIINSPFLYWIHEAPYDYGRYTRFFYEDISKQLNMQLCEFKKMGGAFDVISDIRGKLIGNSIPYLGGYIAKYAQKFHYYIWNKIPVIKKGNEAKSFALGYFAIYKKHSVDI